MTRRRGLKLSGVILAFYVSVCLAAGVYVAEGTIHPVRRQLTAADEGREILRARDEDATLTDVSIAASDGIQLRGWDLHPEHTNGNAVILFHGVSDNRLGMTRYADLFLQHGYDVLMPDARAHGLSDGGLATYGLLETNDIRLWFDWLMQTTDQPIVFTLSLNPWERLSSCKQYKPSRISAPSLENVPSPISARSHMTGWVNTSTPDLGLAGRSCGPL